MLDPKYLQDAVEELQKALINRQSSPELVGGLTELAKKRRELIKSVEELKALKNKVSSEIAMLKAKIKSDPSAAPMADQKVLEMKDVGAKIKELDDELSKVQLSLDDQALRLPNIPHESVPVGKEAGDNVEARKWGKIPQFNFTPKDHVALGEDLGILDFERGAKLSGARFTVYFGQAARLERALIQFMLDLHTSDHGYTEVIPPFMVNRESMTGTGQLPKFEEDLFKTSVADRELFLIPTSEVPLTNLFRNEIIEPGKLPYFLTAYSPCFRSEAGSYGKDVKGLIRQHQFQKVEMVKITDAESSYQELEKMVANAEKVLQLLELPYRVVLLCTGDMGFGASKTYDLEVWLPSQNTYREISSCSNCGDFQARRAQIRYRSEASGKPKLAHTLNGSGLAVGRTLIAILENYQDADGNVKIPKVLEKYLEGAPGFERQDGALWIKKKSAM